jgi:hypothetical protein
VIVLVLAMGVMVGPALASTEVISDPSIVYQDGDPTVEIIDRDSVGALHINTPDAGDKAQVLVTAPEDIALGDLGSLSYRVQRDAGAVGEQQASLNIIVDPWAGTFVYEPVYDASATVLDGEWQEWDAFGEDARWWNSSDPNTFVSWDEIIDGLEDRTVVAIMVNQGSGNAGLQSYTDWVEVDGITYDFVPASQEPQDKDACKNGGWELLEFRNQGQCIRYVNTGQDSR